MLLEENFESNHTLIDSIKLLLLPVLTSHFVFQAPVGAAALQNQQRTASGLNAELMKKLETAIPPRIHITGARTSINLTITPAK